MEGKFRTCENALKGLLNASFKSSGLLRRLIEAHQPLNIHVTQIAAIGAARQRGDDLSGARFFFSAIRRTARENATSARCVSGSGGIEGPCYHEHLKVRMS